MNYGNINILLHKVNELLEIQGYEFKLRKFFKQSTRDITSTEEFVRILTESTSITDITIVREEWALNLIKYKIQEVTFPLVAFTYLDKTPVPVILYSGKRGNKCYIVFENYAREISNKAEQQELFDKLLSWEQFTRCFNEPNYNPLQDPRPEERTFIAYGCVFNSSLFSLDKQEKETAGLMEHLTPVARFWRYVISEKRDIGNIYIYAIVVGLISLSLPLGIQAVIQMISGGQFFDSSYLVIALVVLGVSLTGVLQLFQIYLVEILQRRIFTRAAYEFAFRIPRMRAENLAGENPPELVNRFFDVLTLQKGFSKILLDLTTAALQVLFGLLLLSFYHPTFIIFNVIFVIVVILVFRVTGRKGLDTSIKESKYKYKMVAWLEEMAKNMNTFKMASYTDIALEKTDEYTNHYLDSRRKHFKVLMTQYINIIVFKVAIITATLILGSVLVVGEQINLGTFVASEIVIVLILGAIEKIIVSVDTVYDVFTACDKIGHVTDYPLEREGGIRMSEFMDEKITGLSVEVNGLSYKYKGNPSATLHNISFTANQNQHICLAGYNGSGKRTIHKILSGIFEDYSGTIDINGIPLKNLDLDDFREMVALNLTGDELFEGTVIENISMGKHSVSESDVIWALKKVGLFKKVSELPQGIYTKIQPYGSGFSPGTIRKFVLARNLVKKPKLLLFNDFFTQNDGVTKQMFIDSIFSEEYKPTIIAISNDPTLHRKAAQIFIIDEGKVITQGTFEQLKDTTEYKKLIATTELL